MEVRERCYSFLLSRTFFIFFYYLGLLSVSEGTLSRWSQLNLQSVAPTNPHWARVVIYSPFSLCVSHKEGVCASSEDINRLMMMMMITMTS
jgi:hypothetical protein